MRMVRLRGRIVVGFYGVRVARLIDSFGNRWTIGQRNEDLTQADAHARYETIMA